MIIGDSSALVRNDLEKLVNSSLFISQNLIDRVLCEVGK